MALVSCGRGKREAGPTGWRRHGREQRCSLPAAMAAVLCNKTTPRRGKNQQQREGKKRQGDTMEELTHDSGQLEDLRQWRGCPTMELRSVPWEQKRERDVRREGEGKEKGDDGG